MDSLPYEILASIVARTNRTTKLSLLCTSAWLYPIALEQLFSRLVLAVDPYSGDLTLDSARLLHQLYSRRTVRGKVYEPAKCVRSMRIIFSPAPSFPVSPRNGRTLWAAVGQLVRNRDVASNLLYLQWHTGCLRPAERLPLVLPHSLQTLDASACHLDTSITLQRLTSLKLRHISPSETAWISRQVQQSQLRDLCLSGASDCCGVQLSACIPADVACLRQLRTLELQFVNLDRLALDPATRLTGLVLRCCLGNSLVFDACRPNADRLASLTVVTDRDLDDPTIGSYMELLSACTSLKALRLLLGGRTSTIPIKWTDPVRHRLETLVLEGRQFVVAPTINFTYTPTQVEDLIQSMPKLRVLGLPIALSSPIVLASGIRLLHVRNLPCTLPPADALAKLLSGLVDAKHAIIMTGCSNEYRAMVITHGSPDHPFRIVVDEQLLQYSTPWVEPV